MGIGANILECDFLNYYTDLSSYYKLVSNSSSVLPGLKFRMWANGLANYLLSKSELFLD